MREIRFRGLSYDYNNSDDGLVWAYGYFCGCPTCKEIYSEPHMQKNGAVCGQITAVDGSYGNVGVLEGTVGQYTGYKDGEGKDIYEGDVVSFKLCCWGIRRNDEEREELKGAVEWDELGAEFTIRTTNENYKYLSLGVVKGSPTGSFKIVGTIHDSKFNLKQIK